MLAQNASLCIVFFGVCNEISYVSKVPNNSKRYLFTQMSCRTSLTFSVLSLGCATKPLDASSRFCDYTKWSNFSLLSSRDTSGATIGSKSSKPPSCCNTQVLHCARKGMKKILFLIDN